MREYVNICGKVRNKELDYVYYKKEYVPVINFYLHSRDKKVTACSGFGLTKVNQIIKVAAQELVHIYGYINTQKKRGRTYKNLIVKSVNEVGSYE